MNTIATQSECGQIFFNSVIHTVDSHFSKVSVLAIQKGVIVYVGESRDDAASLLPAGAEHTDLHGRTIVPGLIDSHLHFQLQGQRLSEIDIYLKTKEDILKTVAMEAERLKPGTWILGSGWNHEIWKENIWPCKEDLDSVAPHHPVALTRTDAHSMWVNSLALEAADIHQDTTDPAGGEILRTSEGKLQGILIDTPMFKVWAVIPPPDEAQIRNAFIKAQEELFSYGITSAGDAWQTAHDHENLKRAYSRGDLKIRLYGMLASVDMNDKPCFNPGTQPTLALFDQRLSLRAFKVVLDGSLGSRSAWLTQEYADRSGHKGNSRYTDDQLYELIRAAAEKGFQICAHAIGDAAVLQAFRVMGRLRGKIGSSNLRHRIEHFQMLQAEDVKSAIQLGIIPAMQTIHAAADRKMAETRLSASSLEISYPWRQVIDNGGIIANGSDSPMEVVNPFLGFYAAVTRTSFSSCKNEDHVRMTRKEALQSYTVWPAYAEFAENSKGSLEPGKLADFAILDRDIMVCPVSEIPHTQVLATVLGGELVYKKTLCEI